MTHLLFALGRAAIAAIFLVSGFGKLMGPAALAGQLAAKGLPAPQILAYATIAAELGLGALVAIGWQTRIAAAGLVGFTLAATYFFHNFWDMSGAAAQGNRIHAMKNLAICGGLLMLAAAGPGRFSVGGK